MPDPNRNETKGRRNHRRVVVLLLASVGLLVAGAGGAAFAVSGGGYSPYQQGCQPGDSDYATPDGQTYAGCHTAALNVESGGTTNGDANDGNTKYAQFGMDQEPTDPKAANTNTPYAIGLPGTSTSPHSFCASANTAGTNSAPAPENADPVPPGQAADAPNGCGGNAAGSGFTANLDYYQYYCPIAAMLDNPCEATSWGTNTITPYTGQTFAYQPIVDNGLLVYYGMDDNSDNGEHDGLGPYSIKQEPWNSGAENGSSDGGAIMLLLTPMKAGNTPTQTNPEGLVNVGMGFCADGICGAGTTEQQTVYHGCDANSHVHCDKGTPQNANVYNYAPGGNPANDPSVNSESQNCNSGDPSTTSQQACGPGGMNAYRSATPANENVEPGVQIYTDPDPQRSPAAPSPFWPTPALYVGTCGVYAGSPATTGKAFGSSPTPATNQAGQVAIDPNPTAC